MLIKQISSVFLALWAWPLFGPLDFLKGLLEVTEMKYDGEEGTGDSAASWNDSWRVARISVILSEVGLVSQEPLDPAIQAHET